MLGIAEPSRLHVALLSSAVTGADVEELIRFTGWPADEIRGMVTIFEEKGIWKDGKVYANWFGSDGGLNFVLDCAVVDGLVQRVRDE